MRALIVAFCLVTTPALAERMFYNGRQLGAVCSSGDAEVECLGLIAGLADGILAARPDLCLPDDIDLERLRSAILWEVRKAERVAGTLTAAALTIRALETSFPCPR